MSKRVTSEGVYGGLNETVEKTTEENEPRNFRPNDNIDSALKEFVTREIGAHIVQKTFRIEVPLTRGMDITFDRFYPKLNLLVHSFARRRTYDNLDDPAFDANYERMAGYAEENGYLFLAIIDGDIQRDDLLRVRSMIAA